MKQTSYDLTLITLRSCEIKWAVKAGVKVVVMFRNDFYAARDFTFENLMLLVTTEYKLYVIIVLNTAVKTQLIR